MFYGQSNSFNPYNGIGGGVANNPSSSNQSTNNAFNWSKMVPGAINGVGSLIGGYMNGSNQMQQGLENSQRESQKYFDQGLGYLQPYQQGGQQAYGQYQNWLGQMQDPTQYYNNVMNSYSMSPAAQFQMEQGTQAANNSAASAGNIGTPAAQKALMRYSQGLSNQDMQNYFNNVQGVNELYGGGLNTLNQMGYGASGQMNQNRMGLGSEMSNLAQLIGMAQGYGQQQQGGGIAQMLGSIGGSYFGGPIGGAVGGGIGSLLGF